MTNRIALIEQQENPDQSFTDADYGELPVTAQIGALEAYRAFDDGTLAEAPFALAAYVSSQQQFSV
ncbi:MAG: hypothetical protein ACR2Q3_19990 [Woeseiaceae bacterium]